MEQPIIENITDDNGNIRRSVWLNDDNVMRLFIEPRGMTNDDAKHMLELDALKAENEKLRKALEDIHDSMVRGLRQMEVTKQDACDKYSIVKKICREALAEEKQS